MIHLLLLIPNNPLPFEWISQHLQAVGWPVLIVCAWKIRGYFERVVNKISKTVDQVDVLATNHIPHLQDGTIELVALAKTNNALLGKMVERMEMPFDKR